MLRILGIAVVGVVLLAGCAAQDGIAGQDGGGYISGDGSVLTVPEASRVDVGA